MSSYVNPLDNPAHDLHAAYVLAWDAKRNGKPKLALRLWQEVLDQNQLAADSAEYIEIRRQMAVCLRLMMRLRAADKMFQEVYSAALPLDHDLTRAILLDWSAVLLDRCRARRATALLEPLFESDLSDLQQAQVQAYLGRAYGHRWRRRYRAKGLAYLSEAADTLQGQSHYQDLRVDVFLWMAEVRMQFGRERHCRYSFSYILRFVKSQQPARVTDLRIRHIGGARLHRWLRWGVGLVYRLQT